MSEITMTRIVSFSSGHRYWFNHLSEDENREIFGDLASPYNHGHNYVLHVKTKGVVDPKTGMIVNIKRIDDILKEKVLGVFEQKSINDEVPGFEKVAPCLENLLIYFRENLRDVHEKVKLVGIKLEETPLIFGEWEEGSNMTSLTRKYEFAASHRLHVPELSHEENLRLFGKCNNPAGHGHNYELLVTVTGEPDEKTGMIVNLHELDQIVEDEILCRYDHKNLDVDVPELKDKNTTSEVVVQAIFDRLKEVIPAKLQRVRLYETARNVFEASANS